MTSSTAPAPYHVTSGSCRAAAPDIAERLLELARKRVDQAEVYLSESEELSAQFNAGRVRTVGASRRLAVAMRVIKDGRLGFYATSDLTDLRDVVDRVVAAATEGQEANFDFSAKVGGPGVKTWDGATAALEAADLVAMGSEWLAKVSAAEPEAVVNGLVQKALVRTHILTSNGQDAVREDTGLAVEVEALRTRQNDVANLWKVYHGVRRDVDLDAKIDRLCRDFRLSREITTVRPGKMPVILSPEQADMFLTRLAEGVSGRNVRAKVSPLVEKVGQLIVDASVNVVEDPTLDLEPGSGSFDDEGVPTARTPILKNGVLQGFMYDLATAADLGVRPTGHGRRHTPFSPPNVGPANMVLEPGHQSLDELMADIEEGLYVEEVIGGTGNLLDGAFSHPIAMAFKIEGGRLAGRVKDVSIAGNIYELMRDHLGGLENRAYSNGGWFRAPHIRLNDVSVAGKP